MKAELHVYQEHAKQCIINQDAAGLFLDMGLGKTLTSLAAINELMFDRFEVARVLIIAPLRVARTTWTDEIAKWEDFVHFRTAQIIGTAAQRRRALEQDADIYIINRENVQWLIEQHGKYTDAKRKQGFRLTAWPFDMVVVDELSSFKDRGAQRFKYLRKARPLINKMVGLTGTPAAKGLLDLWAQVYLLDGGERLGKTLTAYKDRFFKPGRQDRSRHIVYEWIPREGSEEKIYEQIGDLCISMKAEDWLDMPERIDRQINIALPNLIMESYIRLELDLILELDGQAITAGTAAALTGKLQQYAQGAVYTEHKPEWQHIHDAKLEALEELIEAASGQPVLIAYWFKHDLARLLQRIPGARQLETEEDIHAWNRKEIPILLVHPASAGHGLNLQAGGSVVIWFSLTWNLELYQQTNARLARQGQASPSVIIHHLIAKGTVDEDIMIALERKAKVQNTLMEAVKARIKKYTPRRKV